MSFLDPITAGGPATELATSEVNTTVNVDEAAPPTAGQVLTATSESSAEWQDPPGGDASGLATSGEPVDVASAAPPEPGQVLTATDAEHAVWRVPGLHYDPSIKFWTSSVGSATILPGTWGFIQAPVDAVDPVIVYIVSSLEAPPVDSRFGLYVGAAVDVPVTINVLGASQIQGVDGVLGSSAVLIPGSDYEWVFYHEDGAAVWGLVSDTTGLAKRFAAPWLGDGAAIPVQQTEEPDVGAVLTYQGDRVEWLPIGGGLTYAGSTQYPAFGQWVTASGAPAEVFLPDADDVPVKTVGVFIANEGQDGALLYASAGTSIQLGNLVLNTEDALPLRSGGYYEFTLINWGESQRWVPRGMSNEQPAPLTHHGPYATDPKPNEWVLSSQFGHVVNFPPAPLDGDSFAVFVDGEGCTLVPDTGDNLEGPNGVEGVTGPDTLNVPGSSYYEWIWTAADNTWHPRANLLLLSPNAVASAIRDDTSTSIFSVGDKQISDVLDPVDLQDAATKAYVDGPGARVGLRLRSADALQPGDIVFSGDYADAVTLPAGHESGNAVGVYVTSASATVTAATDDAVQDPSSGAVVAAPAAITLAGPAFYEWIWTEWAPGSLRQWSVRGGA